jgi:hypothetical protein
LFLSRKIHDIVQVDVCVLYRGSLCSIRPRTAVLCITLINKIVEKICKNCEYFVATGIPYFSSPRWGDCMKTTGCDDDEDAKRERGVFVWDNDTCSDFKPKQK